MQEQVYLNVLYSSNVLANSKERKPDDQGRLYTNIHEQVYLNMLYGTNVLATSKKKGKPEDQGKLYK